MPQETKNTSDNVLANPALSKISKPALLEDCQLMVLYDGSTPLKRSHKALLLFMRLASAFNRRFERLKKLKSGKIEHQVKRVDYKQSDTLTKTVEAPVVNSTNAEFEVGELVRVRPIHEIRSLAGSLVIFEGMEKYCGKYFKITKKVTTMYEPNRGKSIRLKNTYLLDGVHCDGRRMYSHEGCNRCCYYFWKGDWLEKASPDEHVNQSRQYFEKSKIHGLNLFNSFKVGALVRIKPFSEIESLLDLAGRTDGLEFMQGMKKLCGREFKMKAKVRFLINEETNEMRYLGNAYILDGVVCEGKGITQQQQCDRACLYVWHRKWLTNA